jgi:hypothetical protein
MERYVYVQHGDSFEKRNVKVGIADYFFAEIQDGLAPGDVVSLELPKDEIEKKSRMIAGQRNGGEPGASGAKPGAAPATSRTNATTAETLKPAAEPSAKTVPTAATRKSS